MANGGYRARTFHLAMHRFRHIFTSFAVFVSLLWLLDARNAFGQPVPRIDSLSPKWIQRGITNQVVLEGTNLAPVVRGIFRDEKEISASIYAAQPPLRLEASQPGVLAEVSPAGKRVTLNLAVSADAVPGTRELRVVTPTGLSNPIKFNVSDIPEITEMDNDNSLETAQAVSLPVGISGRIGAGNETDYFRFKARKGERLIFDVDANRSGSQLDSWLALLDATGKELARNDDANGFDSLIDFTVPADGEYILQLRDSRYRGGGDYTYHLRCGALPYIDSIFPFGGQRGKPVDVTLRGRNLEENGIVHLKLDAAAPSTSINLRGHTPAGFSNPRRFAVGRLPEITEQEPNDTAANANEVMLPVTINGRIQAEKDTDIYKFKADKGQRFIFDVAAGSFGSPLDPVVVLRNAGNEILQQNNGSGGADSRIDYTFEQSGEYFVSLRDLLDRGGEDFGYRLTIQPPPKASFNARLASDAQRVSRGSRAIIRVEVGRSDFGGPVEINAETLPRGVHCQALLVPSALPGGWLELAADADADLGTFPIKLMVTGEIGGKRVSRPVDAPGDGEGGTKGPFLTVLDRPPFTVDWVTLAGNVRQESSMTLMGQVKRADGFKDEVTVSLEGFSADNEEITKSLEGASAKVAGDASAFSIQAKARMSSELGTRLIMLKAEAKVDGADVVQFSDAIPLTITEYPFVLSSSLPRLSLTVQRPGVTSASGEAEFSVKVQRRGWFTDAIALTLKDLPEGIVATATNLSANVGDALFRLTTNDKVKPGTNTFTIVGTADVNGNHFEQTGPSVVLTINPPSDAAETAKQ